MTAQLFAGVAAVAALLAGCDPAPVDQPVAQAATPLPVGEGFDFYVLALSWSPSYCEAEGEAANRQQCGSGNPHGFIVHGLWPQWERGYPQDCSTAEETVSAERLRTLYDLIPSAGLIRHQWRKHGSCAGLPQSDYFDVLRAARDRIGVPERFEGPTETETLSPDAVESAFVETNPGLGKAGMAVTCADGVFREVRICMTKALEFRDCPEVDARACRSGEISVPPVGDD